MSDSMVERVARAIYEGRNGSGCTPWVRQTSAHKAPYLSDARAAIAAMRTPTEEILSATADNMELWDRRFTSPNMAARSALDAFIDAALSRYYGANATNHARSQ